jgi:hypothetical protein
MDHGHHRLGRPEKQVSRRGARYELGEALLDKMRMQDHFARLIGLHGAGLGRDPDYPMFTLLPEVLLS